MPGQQVKCERETYGNGLVTIGENREQVIAHVAIGQRRTVSGGTGRCQKAFHEVETAMLAYRRFLAGFANQSFQELVNRAEGLTQSSARRKR
jgi:hypothetical protein